MDNPLGTLIAILARGAPFLTLLAAAWAVSRAAERVAPGFGLSRAAVAGLSPTLVVAAIGGGRLAVLLPHWRMSLAFPLDLLRVTDRLSLLGGIAGGVLGLVIFGRRARLPLPRLADAYGTALPLGVAVYGLGCLVRDNCYGRVAPAPFGIIFPGMHVPRYPVELYAAAAALLAFAVVLWARSWRPAAGTVAFLSLALLAGSQAALDLLKLRADGGAIDDQRLWLGVTAVAVLAIPLNLARWPRRPRHAFGPLAMNGSVDSR